MSIKVGSSEVLSFQFDQATLIANTSIELVAPIDGYLDEIQATVQGAVTTGGTIQAIVGTTNVQDAVVTIANAATKGTRAAAKAKPGHASRIVKKGDRIQVKPTSFATAGAVNGNVRFVTGF